MASGVDLKQTRKDLVQPPQEAEEVTAGAWKQATCIGSVWTIPQPSWAGHVRPHAPGVLGWEPQSLRVARDPRWSHHAHGQQGEGSPAAAMTAVARSSPLPPSLR